MKKLLHFSLKVTGVVIGVVFLCFISFIIIMSFLFGGFGNNAEKEFDPIAKELENLNAEFICDNGDGGHGIDNNSPWYTSFYKLQNTPDLTHQLINIMNKQGFRLETNNDSSRKYDPYKQTINSPNTEYLITTNDKKIIKIKIVRDEKIPLYCNTKFRQKYGLEMIPEFGKSIIMLELTLPEKQ